MRNIIKNLGSIMLLTCLSLILLTGCSRKSQLKLAIEMANKQCPMSIGTTGEMPRSRPIRSRDNHSKSAAYKHHQTRQKAEMFSKSEDRS